MLVPITQPAYYSNRPSLALQPSETISLAGGPGTSLYGLHPIMPRLQQLWNNGNVAFVTKVGNSNNPSGSHFAEIARMASARTLPADNGDSEPGWITRVAQNYFQNPEDAFLLNESGRGDFRPDEQIGIPGGITIPDMLAGFKFKSQNNAVQDHVIRRSRISSLLAAINTTRPLEADAKRVIQQSIDLEVAIKNAVASYVPAPENSNQEAAPSFAFRDMARLIKGGFTTRIFYTGFATFDHHAEQGSVNGKHALMLYPLDRGLGDLVLELQDAGGSVWNDTVISVISEFGRRNTENGSGGTDHGEGGVMILIGGAVNGGIYGPPLTQADLLSASIPVGYDWRDAYREIMMNHMNMDPAPIFTEAQNINTGPLGFI
jgi:uncharacterized protein (DUF1501 family)